MNINLTLSCVFHFPHCYKVIGRLGLLHIRATTLNGWDSSGLSSLHVYNLSKPGLLNHTKIKADPTGVMCHDTTTRKCWYIFQNMTSVLHNWNYLEIWFDCLFRLYKPLSMLLRWNLKENIDRGKRNFLIWKALIMFAPLGTFYAIKRHYICILKRHFIETCHRGISGSFQTPA